MLLSVFFTNLHVYIRTIYLLVVSCIIIIQTAKRVSMLIFPPSMMTIILSNQTNGIIEGPNLINNLESVSIYCYISTHL